LQTGIRIGRYEKEFEEVRRKWKDVEEARYKNIRRMENLKKRKKTIST